MSATCRMPEAASALRDLAEAYFDLIRVERLDVADFTAIEALAICLSRPIDALINNAGIAWREARFGALGCEAWRRVLTSI